ncbi:MAG TPA: uracil-DNA glycosylase [Pyrinomonadaceae bacterium]|jgi:DNA polymerase
MGDKPASLELLALAEETGEYLSYMRELGIEAVDYFSGPEGAQASDSLVNSARSQESITGEAPPATLDASLRRNAEAAAQSTAQASPPDTQTSQHAELESVSQPLTDETEMATRKTKKYPDAVPPPPQETLFGEVTPQDQESLPKPDETLEEIRDDIGLCMRCPLCCQGRTQVVNSEGNRQARLMFVGEAPGADEDASGRPFVGRAGQLLNKIIEAINMKREDVFIGNVNRCRPPQNRTPTSAEAAICKPFLLREIDVVRPEVIVVLGNTAMKNLLDTKEGITKLRGKFQDYRGIKVMPTFHPAYLLRDPSKKREAWEDMKKVRDYLDGKIKA